MSLQVSFAGLVAASNLWDDQAEALHGASGSLDDADLSCLGPRVEAAAVAFVNTWSGVVSDLEGDAAEHAAALREFAVTTAGTDAAVSDDLAGLLPYGTTG